MTDQSTKELDCALCIVGAGYAGLNALNAAAKYLPAGARVVVLDRNATWGGQWIDQYRFVRLHQPHRLFVAGDQPWALDAPPEHLATHGEILDYLTSVPRISAAELEVDARFGHEYRSHSVDRGRVLVRARDAEGRALGVRADRLLIAKGFDITIRPPFPIASDAVESLSVTDPRVADAAAAATPAPLVVIGSGKTAMDCVLHLVGLGTRRPIHVVTGRGSYFMVRDTCFPTGWRRHVSGLMSNTSFLETARLYEGGEGAAVYRWHLERGYMHSVFPDPGSYMLGQLSTAERTTIAAAVAAAHRGHLVDVVGERRPRMVLRCRDGELREVPVAPGATFINCTNHLEDRPHRPVLTDGGLVCAPQLALVFSGSSAYFATHLWYRDELGSLAGELRRPDWNAAPLAIAPRATLVLLANMLRMIPRLPRRIAAAYLGDFNLWYPPHRRIRPILRLLAARSMIEAKAARWATLRYSDVPAAQGEQSRSPGIAPSGA
ncbi:MAG: hypothetical protein CMN30_30095 [Sandaracinus sp.]|nr:hypothetical protein [Sandaracinus sp.]|tara:strand:+ start:2179 stop:3654 length:1476 start_codon:yes stop_codon:yes gene_type:complete